ncbi:MAG: Crp/Fnr family transcriptional regulator [Vicinamibacterales bacterium]
MRFPAGSLLIHEGQAALNLYTLLEGWAYRFRTLANGRRQILDFLLPGDLIGAQHAVSGNAWHGVRTLTEATVCVFGHELLSDPAHGVQRLNSDICVLMAHECSSLEESLVSLGQRTALERMAALFLVIFRRAAALQTDRGASGVFFPVTQQEIADTLGLSLVHTNKTMRRLEKLTGSSVKRGRLRVEDLGALSRVANLYSDGRPIMRPLL